LPIRLSGAPGPNRRFDSSPPDRKTRTTEPPFDGYASGFKDNIVVPYEGLPAREMKQRFSAST
jgi:hypothetical protein